MIEPGELYRYFAVRETATGREVWLMNWDVRYESTADRFESIGRYRPAPDGEYFLVEMRAAPSFAPGFLLRLEDVEPLPDGAGLYHPDHLAHSALSLRMSYEGSWRQFAASDKTSSEERGR